MDTIDKQSSIPLYMQLYTILKGQILDQTYPPDSYLPSELELQKKYDLSRITVRRTLSDLEKDGYIQRIRGKGSRVHPQKKYTDLFLLTGFNEDALREGHRPASIILRFDSVQASVEIAEGLQIDPGEEVFYLKRLRLLNGRVNGVHHTYISKRLGLEFEISQWTEKTSLYHFYEENGIHVCDATEVIEAMLPTPELVTELYISEHEPVFYRKRITYDERQIPIEYSHNYYIAKEHKYFVKLQRKEDS